MFGYSITRAGNIAAIFGCLNFISRPLGGVLSDLAGKFFGMRGRLWSLFATLTIGGMGVAVLGTQKANDKTTIAMMVIAGWFLEVIPHTSFSLWQQCSSRSLLVGLPVCIQPALGAPRMPKRLRPLTARQRPAWLLWHVCSLLREDSRC